MKKDYEFTPISLRSTGRAWLKMYESSLSQIKSSPEFLIVSFILFCFGLEIYLKAYICLHDKKMANENSMKSLSHNFRKISEKINEIGPTKFAKEVENKLDHFNLRNNNFTELRYPKSGRMTTFDQDIFQGKHGFKDIIHEIDTEISQMDYKEWQQS